MRVLQVIHDYLPRHAAGSEIYTAHLCAALRGAGHEVAVFTCEEERGLPQWSLREREHDGVHVFEGIYNRIYEDVSEHWDDPKMGAVFAGVLERWKPDLLHVQGMQFVGGVSALEAATARGVPIVMTLHEYWWLCPRSGLMYDLDGRACERATPTDCARCVDVYPIDRERWSDARHANAFSELGDRRWFARALVEREQVLKTARARIGRYIAPSNFLLERFVAAGFPRERMLHADYGFPPAAPARRTQRAPGAPLRAGFVGTLSDYKGALVLARAAARLADAAPEGAAVQIALHGHLDWFPDIAAELRAIAARCLGTLLLPGPFERARLPEILAGLDVLVVPSLWWENSPLTIHEAWQHGVPVLASDRGGMAELLAQGGGATFAVGDEAALAAALRRAATDPAWLARLAASIPPVRPIAEDVALLERLGREIGA